MTLKKIQKKMLKTYHKILKASVKRKFDKADELNWKLLQLEILIKDMEDNETS